MTSEIKVPSENAALLKWFLVGLAAFGFMMGVLYFMKSGKQSSMKKEAYIAAAYMPPTWPVPEADKQDYIILGIQEFKNNRISRAKSLLLDSLQQSDVGKYWLSELNLSRANYSEVIDYLPQVKKSDPLYDRVNYLHFLSLVGTSQMAEANNVYAKLTDEYKALLPSVIVEQ